MKSKHLLLIALSVFISINLHAQNLRFGLMAGINASKIHTNAPAIYTGSGTEENPYEYDPIITYNINAIAGLKFLKYFGVSIEPGYILKGGSQELESGDIGKYKINYLQLPVMGEIHPVDWFYISLGPEFAYALSAITNVDGTKTDVSDDLTNNNEISGIVEFNFNFNKKIGLGIRYSRALTNVNTRYIVDSQGALGAQYEENNQYLQINLKYFFKGSAY